MPDSPEPRTIETAGKAALRKRLKAAIEQGHIWPAFQPIVDIRSGALAGFEILARWSDPEEGEISPLAFIPRLEQYGLVDILSDALVRNACSAAVGWPGDFSLAFNISPVQFARGNLSRQIVETVLATGFPIPRVQVEVTEGSLIADAERAYATLRELDALGIRIAIDDFGTGYSSLARLEAFPFHKLKIDACFVRSLDLEAGKRRIVAATIGLGQSLGIIIVAEGVETGAEEAILRDFGCDLGQGWLYGKGVPAREARTVLERRGAAGSSSRPLDASPFQQLHQLAALYRQAPVGLAFLDLDFRHVRSNDRFASIHGLTGAELEGRSIHEVMEGKNLEIVQGVLRKSARSDQPIPQQYILRGRDILVFTTRVTDLDGEIIGYSVVVIDMTDQNRALHELAESEEHFRRATELNPDIAWSAAPDGTINYISPTAEDIPGDTMRQRIDRWIAQIHPEDRSRIQEEWREWISTGKNYETEFRILGAGGLYRWVRSRARPHRTCDGLITRWYGVISDASDLKHLQDRILELEGTQTTKGPRKQRRALPAEGKL